ncbi:transposase [Actinomadura xylanilytica]|nr:transposase [Actinomadura xylanilytica]MDL4775208.1 transposase [Actinomadura xylanilytica]
MPHCASHDAKVMSRFLARLVWHFDRKVHLIGDRHSVHHSKAVRAWLADHKGEIELHFLPSYSPELNPDELVNAELKGSLPHTHRARPRVDTGHFAGELALECLAQDVRFAIGAKRIKPLWAHAAQISDDAWTPAIGLDDEGREVAVMPYVSNWCVDLVSVHRIRWSCGGSRGGADTVQPWMRRSRVIRPRLGWIVPRYWPP